MTKIANSMDIPAYNYCDRWCARCLITARCTVYAREANLTEEQRDPSNSVFWEVIQEHMDEAFVLLQKMADEYGFVYNEQDDAEWERRENLKDEEIRRGAIHRLCVEYNKAIHSFLSAGLEERIMDMLQESVKLGLYNEKEEQKQSMLRDCVEVIQWYRFLIDTKLFRAMSGLLDQDAPDEIALYDSNGSAKVALLGIDRSIAAWKQLYDMFPDEEDEILGYMVLLQKVKTLAMATFPDADKFIRPGFED